MNSSKEQLLLKGVIDSLEKQNSLMDILTGGIDFDLPGNGGPQCERFTEPQQRIIESAYGLSCSCLAIFVGWKWSKSEKFKASDERWEMPTARLILIILISMAFGMELCYKLASKQLIYILNPCHIFCVLQIVILCLNPVRSKLARELFKISLNLMHLPICACVLPVTNTLFLPGEIFTYWWEHILLLIIPIYLFFEGRLTPEPLQDLSYTLKAYGYFGIFNFLFLHPLSYVTLANLDLILCPGITDPFRGPNYRMHALWHQLIQGLIGGKVFGLIGKIADFGKMSSDVKSVKLQ